jgi:hypothetical protein
MSFRQDRTNPSSAVSNWKGRTDTPKAWPSTSVSTWLNSGLFGGGGNGYIFRFGLPDVTVADFYPYTIYPTSTSGVMRVSGRWNDAAPNADMRIVGFDIDLSGGLSSPPTSVSNQTAWSFSITGTAQEGIYSEQPGGLWVDGSDNNYSVGNVWGTITYDYYNLGFAKYNSSGVQQWQTVFRQNTGQISPGMQRAVCWHGGPDDDAVFLTTMKDSVAGANRTRHQMVPCDEGTGAELSGSYNRMIYPNNESSSVNNWMGNSLRRSNTQGDHICTVHQAYDNTMKNLIVPIVWEMGRGYSVESSWPATAWIHIQNTSTGGGGDLTPTGVHLDSSGNVYVACYFPATNIDGSGADNNVVITKWNSSGVLQWRYCLRQQANGREDPTISGDLVIDGTDLYVSGYSTDVSGSGFNAPWIAKLDVSGTPALTWITQVTSPSYSNYASTISIIGDQVVSTGYGQTTGTGGSGTPVVGMGVSLNKDGTSLGTADVDDITYTARDISSYTVFANAADPSNPDGTANVEIGATAGYTQQTATDNTTSGYFNTKLTEAPGTTNTVEGGGIS